MFTTMGMLVAGGSVKAEFVASGILPSTAGADVSLTLPAGVKQGDTLIVSNPYADPPPTMANEWLPFGPFAWMYPNNTVFWRPITSLANVPLKGTGYAWAWAIYRNVLAVADVVDKYQSPIGADYIDIDWPAKGPGVVGLVAFMHDRDTGPASPANPNYSTRLQQASGPFSNTIADRLDVPGGAHTDRFSGFQSYYGQMARGLELRRLSGVPYDTTTPPVMSAPNAPIGHQALANSNPNTAWRAFRPGSLFWSADSDVAWIQRRYPTERKALTYSIKVPTIDCGPTTFELLGSLDSVTWARLDLRIAEATWAADEVREYEIASPGAYFYYRLDITDNSARSDLVRIEDLTFTWDDGTTVPFPVDIQPDAFEFVDVSDATVSTPYTSLPITVSGIAAPSPITVMGGFYSVNGGTFTSASGFLLNGDEVRARGTSGGAFGDTVGVTVSIGGVSDTFLIATGASDTTPDAFAFAPVTNAEPSREYESNSVTVSGINVPVPVTVTAGHYSKNGAPYTAEDGTAVNGDSFKVKLMSASTLGASLSLSISIGSASTGFSVETAEGGIAVSNQASPMTGWGLAALADLALIDPQPGEYIEIEGAPAGFAIVGA